jgi:AcrR family transcriptional regulator
VALRSARTPRLAPEERQRQLLDAALDVLVAEGLDALTVEAVARRAGVTRPVVYDQFGDLDGLLVALVDREEQVALGPLLAIVGAEPGDVDPDRFLADGVRSFLRSVREEPRTWRLVLMPPDGGSPDVRARVQGSRRLITDRVTKLLAWGVERRGGPAGIDAGLYGRLLVAAGEDAARLVLSDPDRYSPERLAEAADSLVALVPRHGALPSPAVGGPPPPAPPAPPHAPSTGPSGRVPRAQRREQLLDHALALVAEEGFDVLTIEAIARRAGVSRVVVYRSFGNLQVLMLTLLQREEARVRPRLEALVPAELGGHAPRDLLVDGLVGFLELVTTHPLTWRLALQRPESAPKALQKAVARRRADLAARLRPLVAAGLEALDAPVEGLDVDLLARLLLTLGEEHGRIVLEDPDLPVERLIDNARGFLELLPWR